MTIDLETDKDLMPDSELDNITVISAGQLLREARLAQGISIQEVSDNIHLKLVVIENIEQGVLDKHISTTFMRGYIRCYARYLKISERDVLAAYNAQYADCEQQAELQSFSRRTKHEAHDNRLMLVSYGIIGFMLIVFLIWGFQRNDVAVVVPAPELSVELASVPLSPPLPVRADTVDAVNSTAEVENTAIDPSAQPPTVITPVAELLPVMQPIQLNFAGDCWVQIKDSQGKTLVIGIQHAGKQLQLQGQAPLHITLGAPEQVSLRFAGDDIDLSKFKQGRVAKFTLPLKLN